MATDRQIAANRRNAARSTGPKSSVGKKRSSQNSYRHGLSISADMNGDAETVEQLARKIAGVNQFILQFARSAARAQLDLVRIRALKVAMIKHVSVLGALQPVSPAFAIIASIPHRDRIPELERLLFDQPMNWPKSKWPERIGPSGPMPVDQEERGAEAVRRLAPELRKLDRYERRAIVRRDQALREIFQRRSTETACEFLQNEPNMRDKTMA